MAKRINPDEIDESFIVASVKKDRTIAPAPVQAAPAAPPEEKTAMPAVPDEETATTVEPPKEETRSRREKQQEYESLFIKETDLPPARFGKSVYVRKEFHDRISQIVSVIGGNEVSLFGYICSFLILVDYLVETPKKTVLLVLYP
jgi:hypothetical protein